MLLFRFRFPARSGIEIFWATPGGALDPGEDYLEAAQRELIEETGFDLALSGPFHQRTARFETPKGEQVEAAEEYFAARAPHKEIDRSGWSAFENQIMTEAQWWSHSDLSQTDEEVRPREIADIQALALALLA